MTLIVVPQLLTPRMASMRTRMPWADVRQAIEDAGGRIRRIAGRERCLATDLVALIDAAAQPTGSELAVRTDIALEQACEELGVSKRSRRRKAGVA